MTTAANLQLARLVAIGARLAMPDATVSGDEDLATGGAAGMVTIVYKGVPFSCLVESLLPDAVLPDELPAPALDQVELVATDEAAPEAPAKQIDGQTNGQETTEQS